MIKLEVEIYPERLLTESPQPDSCPIAREKFLLLVTGKGSVIRTVPDGLETPLDINTPVA
jgi:hypothetical protein